MNTFLIRHANDAWLTRFAHVVLPPGRSDDPPIQLGDICLFYEIGNALIGEAVVAQFPAEGQAVLAGWLTYPEPWLDDVWLINTKGMPRPLPKSLRHDVSASRHPRTRCLSPSHIAELDSSRRTHLSEALVRE